MRFIKVSLLAALLLAFGSVSASALTVTLGGADGQLVGVSDQVSITVSLNTDGATNLTIVGVGVLFDDTILAFNVGATVSHSYILYNSSKAAYLQGAGTAIRFGTTDQVNIDFTTSDLLTNQNGTASATGYYGTYPAGINGGADQLMATLVFDVIALGDGVADISLTVSAAGNAIQQCLTPGPGAPPTACGSHASLAGSAVLAGAGTVITPEPTTAVLVGLGLAGLAVAGRRRE
jgi:hypothetical protein